MPRRMKSSGQDYFLCTMHYSMGGDTSALPGSCWMFFAVFASREFVTDISSSSLTTAHKVAEQPFMNPVIDTIHSKVNVETGTRMGEADDSRFVPQGMKRPKLSTNCGLVQRIEPGIFCRQQQGIID